MWEAPTFAVMYAIAFPRFPRGSHAGKSSPLQCAVRRVAGWPVTRSTCSAKTTAPPVSVENKSDVPGFAFANIARARGGNSGIPNCQGTTSPCLYRPKSNGAWK